MSIVQTYETAIRRFHGLPDQLRMLVAGLSEQGYLQVAALWAGSLMLVLASAWASTEFFLRSDDLGQGASCCFPAGSINLANWNAVLARWDAGYYLKIASSGYQVDGDERAFFPLYPYTVKWLSSVAQLDILTAGLVISAFSTLVTVVTFNALIRSLYGPQVALISVASILFFPTAFYLFAFYAEALMLALWLVTVWLARKKRFLLGFPFILLATITRPTGFLVGIPFVIEFFRSRGFKPGPFLQMAIGLAITGVGAAVVLGTLIPFRNDVGYFWIGYVDLTARIWDAHLTWPWITLFDGILAAAIGQNIGSDWFSRAVSIANLAFFFFILVTIAVTFRRIPLSFSIFLIGAVVFFLSVHGPSGYALDTMPRIAAVLFPLGFFPALVVYPRSARSSYVWVILSALALTILSAWFSSGRWVG